MLVFIFDVGERLLVYAWFCYADVKNDKSFLELRCEGKSVVRGRVCVSS